MNTEFFKNVSRILIRKAADASVSKSWAGVHLHQSLALDFSLQLKAEQINKMTTIFTQNDNFFKPDHFNCKYNLLSLEQQLFLSHLEIKRGKTANQLKRKVQ
jgi:hypothetical protein